MSEFIAQTGWICPRCRKIYNPYITNCDCQSDIPIETTNDLKLLPCKVPICRNPYEKAYSGCDICKYNKNYKSKRETE